jgi:hypothetical protein
MPPAMRPFVLLEVGRARVFPAVSRPLSSWVHDRLVAIDMLQDFVDNRPGAVRCIHPWVTCLEKLEAIARRVDKGHDAATFVRHYEDAARIVRAREALPPLELGLSELVSRLAEEDKKRMPPPSHPAFTSHDREPWSEIHRAWDAITPMFWGERMTVEEATSVLRSFLSELPNDAPHPRHDRP